MRVRGFLVAMLQDERTAQLARTQALLINEGSMLDIDAWLIQPLGLGGGLRLFSLLRIARVARVLRMVRFFRPLNNLALSLSQIISKLHFGDFEAKARRSQQARMSGRHQLEIGGITHTAKISGECSSKKKAPLHPELKNHMLFSVG